jgi:hypothetical protein
MPIEGHKFFKFSTLGPQPQINSWAIASSGRKRGDTEHEFSTCANLVPNAATTALADGRTTIGHSTTYSVPCKTCHRCLFCFCWSPADIRTSCIDCMRLISLPGNLAIIWQPSVRGLSHRYKNFIKPSGFQRRKCFSYREKWCPQKRAGLYPGVMNVAVEA